MPATPTSPQTFMVVGVIRDNTNFAEFAALRDAEHQQLDVLRSAGKVGAHHVSPSRRATFLEVIAGDEEQAVQTLAALPLFRFFDTDLYPTAPPDEAEAAHRARLARGDFA